MNWNNEFAQCIHSLCLEIFMKFSLSTHLTEFRNGNVTQWLNYAKHCSSVMNSSLDKYILQDSTNWLVPSTSSTNICNTSFASSVEMLLSQVLRIVFVDIGRLFCWHPLFHIWNQKGQLGAGFSRLIIGDQRQQGFDSSFNWCLFATEKWFQCRVDFFKYSCCFTDFSISFKTSKLDLSKASTVWLLHSKCKGMWDESKALAIFSSISRFFVTASVIIASTFSIMFLAEEFGYEIPLMLLPIYQMFQQKG